MKISRQQWVYCCRAVDRDGKTVDFRLSHRARCHRGFKGVLLQGDQGARSAAARTITLDGYATSHRAVRDICKLVGNFQRGDTKLRSSKYLNNLIEQDHRVVQSYASIQCWDLSGLRPQRSQFPGSNCCTGSTRDSSISAGCVSRLEVRPPSGTRYWQRNKIGTFEARAALQFKLHQNPYEEPKPSIPPPPPDEIKMMRPGGGYEVLTMAEVAARDTAARASPVSAAMREMEAVERARRGAA